MLSDSVQKTREIAKEFLSALKKSDKAVVVGLRGDLGSGKTAFVKMVAEHLGLKGTLSSPTFVIEKIYKLKNKNFNHLIHIDAYRLEDGEELKMLGWDEISADSNNLIFIEWPENVENILPSQTKFIDFKFINETAREINY